MELRRIRTNGTGLNVALDGAGRPVLLLHGWPHTWQVWRPVLPLIAWEREDQALDFIRARENPLAMYVFSRDDDAIARLSLAQVNAAWRKYVSPQNLVLAWGGDFKAPAAP